MRLTKYFAAVVLSLAASGAVRAQGIPVYDNASFINALLQILAWEQQYNQMVGTLQQQKQQIENTTGSRKLGVIYNGITGNVLPTDIVQQIGRVRNHDELNLLAATNFQALSTALHTRATQIQALMTQINATDDPKAIGELAARIQAEQVMATNEQKEAEWLRSQVETQARQLDREQLNRQVNRFR